jgi:hypothetical protein
VKGFQFVADAHSGVPDPCKDLLQFVHVLEVFFPEFLVMPFAEAALVDELLKLVEVRWLVIDHRRKIGFFLIILFHLDQGETFLADPILEIEEHLALFRLGVQDDFIPGFLEAAAVFYAQGQFPDGEDEAPELFFERPGPSWLEIQGHRAVFLDHIVDVCDIPQELGLELLSAENVIHRGSLPGAGGAAGEDVVSL